MNVAGLFAGIGGIERGLEKAGHKTIFLCEKHEAARMVLAKRFPAVPIANDISLLKSLPDCDLVSAGFPCSDLSPAGRTAGIEGSQSGLIAELFKLLKKRSFQGWVLIENVPFMLQLRRGEAMAYLAEQFKSMGYNWAYRVVDTRSFGLPQRRRRVLILASRTKDPRPVLLADEADHSDVGISEITSYGFYWTEGNTGLGWAENAIPTLKSGSSLGIPSPPAIWMPEKGIYTPTIGDAERLQGFPKGWTSPVGQHQSRIRWKLVGNAVSVPVTKWVGRRLANPGVYESCTDEVFIPGKSGWPTAAWSEGGSIHRAGSISEWPLEKKWKPLTSFLVDPMVPLSTAATSGFLKRARASKLKFYTGFLDDIERYLENATTS